MPQERRAVGGVLVCAVRGAGLGVANAQPVAMRRRRPIPSPISPDMAALRGRQTLHVGNYRRWPLQRL